MSDAHGNYSRHFYHCMSEPNVLFCPYSGCHYINNTYERLENHIADAHTFPGGSVPKDEEVGDAEEEEGEEEGGGGAVEEGDAEDWGFKCIECEKKKKGESKKFGKVSGLKSHYKSVHHTSMVGACIKCFRVYFTKAERKAHAC